ncbi:MAG: Type secretion system pilin [Candidatus Parcubacteria bacterium]|jgi:hypothetical protein
MRSASYLGKKFAATIATLGLAIMSIPPALAAMSDGTGLTATAGAAGLGAADVDLPSIIGRFIGGLMALLGVVFVLLLVYGGFIWMTAQGSEEKIKKAKGVITSAVIGLVVVFASYAIAQAVIEVLSSSVATTPPPAS